MDDDRDAALRAVRRAHQALTARGDAERDAILHARELAVTVQDIADDLGVRQPQVNRKYGPLPAGRAAGDKGAARRRLRTLSGRKSAVEQSLLEAVAAARTAHVSWQAIAEALDKHSRSNVIAKYAPLLTTLDTGEVVPAGRPPEPRGQLTADQRVEVTRRVRAGEPTTVLAAEFGVSRHHVRWLRTHGPDSVV